ncbi:gluconate 2-dehydrogenase subunit 3 family protein [Hymenobacter caeli]|uniref:Gluconate 2-dehydrogenase subunit 3 family protein n=1 Tax=Hymenobacter caeli TaxID=2735894 RepID=A0ABX2FUF0_9BACT|nr:gluconate 2-dehydrogenase subunit 3 family protein [Hymenobacter caeli]NRT20463.1 hypothetical protein [Hymenobacter caeli]
MLRRTALKNLAFFAGAATLLPGCLADAKREPPASIALKHVAVSASQEKTLAEVCETILPKTDTPGAKELGIHLYVLKMLDDCCEKKEQQAFVAGLGQLDDAAQKAYGRPFAAGTAPQKLALLQGLERQPDGSSDLASFYHSTKRLAVGGYTTGKYFLTTQIVYELVPSRYNGYFPVSKINLSKRRNGLS